MSNAELIQKHKCEVAVLFGQCELYVSLLAPSRQQSLREVSSALRAWFETVIRLPDNTPNLMDKLDTTRRYMRSQLTFEDQVNVGPLNQVLAEKMRVICERTLESIMNRCPPGPDTERASEALAGSRPRAAYHVALSCLNTSAARFWAKKLVQRSKERSDYADLELLLLRADLELAESIATETINAARTEDDNVGDKQRILSHNERALHELTEQHHDSPNAQLTSAELLEMTQGCNRITSNVVEAIQTTAATPKELYEAAQSKYHVLTYLCQLLETSGDRSEFGWVKHALHKALADLLRGRNNAAEIERCDGVFVNLLEGVKLRLRQQNSRPSAPVESSLGQAATAFTPLNRNHELSYKF